MAEATLPLLGRPRLSAAFPVNGVIAAVLAVVLWQAASLWLNASTVSPPLDTVQRLWRLLTVARYRPDLVSTASGFALALLITWCAGLACAVWFGTRRLAGDVAEPLLVSFYAIPKITLYPIVLLVCGLGMSAKVTFGVIHGIVPVALIGMGAIRNLKPVFIRTARSMQLTRHDTVLHVLLPAILPQLVSGMQIGFSLTLLGTLIGEMFGSKGGLGYMLIRAINLADSDTIMAIALLLLVFALTGNWLLGLVVERLSGRQNTPVRG